MAVHERWFRSSNVFRHNTCKGKPFKNRSKSSWWHLFWFLVQTILNHFWSECRKEIAVYVVHYTACTYEIRVQFNYTGFVINLLQGSSSIFSYKKIIRRRSFLQPYRDFLVGKSMYVEIFGLFFSSTATDSSM